MSITQLLTTINLPIIICRMISKPFKTLPNYLAKSKSIKVRLALHAITFSWRPPPEYNLQYVFFNYHLINGTSRALYNHLSCLNVQFEHSTINDLRLFIAVGSYKFIFGAKAKKKTKRRKISGTGSSRLGTLADLTNYGNA